MAGVNREFLVGFDQAAVGVVNLLPKAQRLLLGVHFQAVAGAPAGAAARYVAPVAPAARGQFIPVAVAAAVFAAAFDKYSVRAHLTPPASPESPARRWR